MDRKLLTALLFTYLAAFSFPATNTVFGSPMPDSDDDAQQDEPKRPEKVEVLTKPGNYVVAEGDPVTLPCEITKGSEQAVIWDRNNHSYVLFLDDRRIQADDSYQMNANRSLTINNVTEQKAGQYRCYINNELTSVVHTVAVQLKVNIGRISKVVEVGGDLFLPCIVTGYPEPTVEWSKQLGATKEVIRRAATYVIRNVNVSDSGVYTCSAWNHLHPEPVTKTVRIKVVNGIAAENDIVHASNFDLEDKVHLCCIIGEKNKADESSASWLKNGVEVSSTDGHYDVESVKHKFCLAIRGVRDDDLATYTCRVAKKSARTSNGTTVFYDKADVKLLGTPGLPTQELITVDENTKWPLLKWNVKTYSPITSYQVYIKKQEHNDWKLHNQTDILGWGKEENIEQIFENLPSGQYNVKLVVFNKHGSTEQIFNGTPLVIDKVDPTVILSAKIQGAGNADGGAVSNFQVSSFCIFFSIVVRLWMSCCC